MKTTLDLPDPLMRRVKIRAATEGRKLKDLVADLLEKGLAETPPATLPAGGSPYCRDPEAGYLVAPPPHAPDGKSPTLDESLESIEPATREEDLRRAQPADDTDDTETFAAAFSRGNNTEFPVGKTHRHEIYDRPIFHRH